MYRVVAVDDSHVIRRLVEVSLEQLSLDIATVATGADAMAALEAGGADLVILDLGLPDMSGWEIILAVRERPELDGLPFVLLTGYSDAEEQVRAEAAGVAAYVVKPFRPADLRRAVLDVLHGRNGALGTVTRT